MDPRIAIACSGLGHVRRGNETWAFTVAQALHAAGVNVTLFGGNKMATGDCPCIPVRNLRRDSTLLTGWLSWHHRYLLEQRTFSLFLKPQLQGGAFDIVHTADPALALLLKRASHGQRWRVVYKDGLLLGAPWCRKFNHVQVLAPYYRSKGAADGFDVANWFVIPHLVDTDRFRPAPNRPEVRARCLGSNVPVDALVTLAVGDFSLESNKRLDWLVEEFARVPNPASNHLVLVGQASAAETRAFEARARARLGERVHLFTNVQAERMTGFYQAADLFAHAALREPFGIVFIEAMACGLPIVAHQFEVTRWIVGDGGLTGDLSQPGELARLLGQLQRDSQQRRELGEAARRRACDAFAIPHIIPLYVAMYQAITG
jgi:1,2-diacylglycerol 3-alpha-glucosyltransferase